MIWLCRSGWPRTWAGICYANVGGVNINDPDYNVTVGVMLGFASFSVVCFYSRVLHDETMVFEAHGTVSNRSKYTPHICVNILLYIFM